MSRHERSPRPKHDSWHLLGCALLCFAVLVFLIIKPLITIGVVLVLVILVGWLTSHPNPAAMTEYARYDTILAETNTLSYDEARTAVEALFEGGDVFEMRLAEPPPGNLERYPPSIQALFSRYACISIYQLAIGTNLPETVWGEDPNEKFILRAPNQLIGTDHYLDGDGGPIVVKDGEEAIYTLETSDEPDPGEQFISPSVYHLLLARARCVLES